MGGRGIGREWADLTDEDPKESSYRMSCTFLPPFGPSLHWVKRGPVLKLDRTGELNEIPLRHSRPLARAGQLLPMVGTGPQGGKKIKVQRARGDTKEQRRSSAAQKVDRP